MTAARLTDRSQAREVSIDAPGIILAFIFIGTFEPPSIADSSIASRQKASDTGPFTFARDISRARSPSGTNLRDGDMARRVPTS